MNKRKYFSALAKVGRYLIVISLLVAINSLMYANHLKLCEASGSGKYSHSKNSFQGGEDLLSGENSSGNIQVTISPSNPSICKGNSVELTASGGTTYIWSTGDTTASITVSPANTTTYKVTATSGAVNGTNSVTVIVSSNPVIAVYPDYGLICAGNAGNGKMLTVSGADNYIWSPSTGLNSSTGSNVIAKPEVTTTYTVTGYTNGCSSTAKVVIVVDNVQMQTTVTSKGNLSNCFTGTDTLEVTSLEASYLWSTGDTTQSTIVTTAGEYTVTITDSSGCKAVSAPYTVNSSNIQNPGICIVSYDSASEKNEVIWNKQITKAINYYNIYREGDQANVYNLIGEVPYDAMSTYIDSTSIPTQQAYLYKISATDSCGSESQLSPYHETIHLSINKGTGNIWNLEWNSYVGFSFSSYNIYRGTSPSDMTLLTTISSSLNSYSDLDAPSGHVYYQIEVINPNQCNPSKSNKYNSSRSNIATNNLSSVNNLLKPQSNINVYPNPAKGNVFFRVSSSEF